MTDLERLRGFSNDLLEKFKGLEESAKGKRSSLFEEVMDSRKSKESTEHFKKERSGLFGEVWESFLTRYFPNVSKFMDLGSTVGFFSKDPEALAWQNEFEAITSLTLLIPDFMLRPITDPLAESELFIKILTNWPVKGEEFAEKIKAEKNPDDVISALRMINQDLNTSKVAFDDIRGWIS
jgi:hypothetical protein